MHVDSVVHAFAVVTLHIQTVHTAFLVFADVLGIAHDVGGLVHWGNDDDDDDDDNDAKQDKFQIVWISVIRILY